MQPDQPDSERPRRPRGRPRKDKKKPRDTHIRIGLAFLARVRRYQKQQAKESGVTKSIGEWLLTAWDVFENLEKLPELSNLHSKERRIMRTITQFLATKPMQVKRSILNVLIHLTEHIALFRRKARRKGKY